jgi:predicted Zn-dependent protease
MRSLLLLSSIILLLFFASLSHASDFRRRASQPLEEELYKTEEDIKAEIIFGRSLSARILGRYPLIKDKRLTEYITLIGKAIAQYAGRPEIEFHFGILDTDTINAFSTPGGYIFITKGALKFAEDEAELAGVLGHEIAHVVERHIVKEINLRAPDESPLTGFASLIAGATGTAEAVFTAFVDRAYEILFERGYKIEDELSSDRLSTGLLKLSGYDPEGLMRFLKRLNDKGMVKEIKGTHPGIEERLKSLQRFMEENHLSGEEKNRGKERFYEKTGRN